MKSKNAEKKIFIQIDGQGNFYSNFNKFDVKINEVKQVENTIDFEQGQLSSLNNIGKGGEN